MKNPTHDTNTITVTSLSSTLLYPKTTSIITKQHCVQIMYLECNGIQIMLVGFCLHAFGIFLQNYSCSHNTFDF